MPGTVSYTHLTRVWYQEKSGQRLTLEQECLRSGTLPSIASVSYTHLDVYKRQVMDCSEDVAGTLRSQEHGHQPLV